MYYYYAPNGLEMVTPNKDLAFARAAAYGSDVFSLQTNLQPVNGKEKI